MFDTMTREEMERLERTVQRLFARVSFLEARVNELERGMEAANSVDETNRPHVVEPLRLTA
jgi:hypothetical protein